MKPNIYLSILVIVIFSYVYAISQQKVMTSDGKTVLLKNDGTWKYLEDTIKAPSSQFDFRKVRWGMNLSQVKKSESAELYKEQVNSLAYKDRIAGNSVLVFYIFVDNKLVRTKYISLEKHTNENDFISDFKQFKKMLTDKYDNPIKDNEYWSNDLYKDDYDRWGFAVSLGHHSYYTSWKTESTDITLALDGENYKINLVIEYCSIKLGHLEDEAKQKKNKDDL